MSFLFLFYLFYLFFIKPNQPWTGFVITPSKLPESHTKDFPFTKFRIFGACIQFLLVRCYSANASFYESYLKCHSVAKQSNWQLEPSLHATSYGFIIGMYYSTLGMYFKLYGLVSGFGGRGSSGTLFPWSSIMLGVTWMFKCSFPSFSFYHSTVSAVYLQYTCP